MTGSAEPVDLTNGGSTYENGVHEALLGEPSKLTHPIKDVKDKYELLPAFLKVPVPTCMLIILRIFMHARLACSRTAQAHV